MHYLDIVRESYKGSTLNISNIGKEEPIEGDKVASTLKSILYPSSK